MKPNEAVEDQEDGHAAPVLEAHWELASSAVLVARVVQAVALAVAVVAAVVALAARAV